MPSPTPPTRPSNQAWCLNGLADSPADVRVSERRLSRERGHEPSLYEVIEDLMARHRIARPFTDEMPIPQQPSPESDGR